MRTWSCLALGLCFVTSSAHADRELVRERSQAGELIDFSGGFVAGQSEVGTTEVVAEFTARYHDDRGFYIGGLFSAGLLVDDSNVENVVAEIAAGSGMSLGLHARVGALQFHSGARGEYIALADGDGMRTPSNRALRGGPEVAMALVVGRMWGHPMSMETRASYLFYHEGQGRYDGARIGLFLTGGLLPEP